MAAVHSNSKFIAVDARINGRISDGGDLSYTEFGKALHSKLLQIPEPCLLPNSTKKLSLVFVRHDTFKMAKNFRNPYSQTGLTTEQQAIDLDVHYVW